MQNQPDSQSHRLQNTVQTIHMRKLESLKAQRGYLVISSLDPSCSIPSQVFVNQSNSDRVRGHLHLIFTKPCGLASPTLFLSHHDKLLANLASKVMLLNQAIQSFIND